MDPPKRYIVVVNGERYALDLPAVQAIQIRALAGIPTEHTLVLEGPGTSEDRLLTDEDLIQLENGPVHFFSKPPTAFGGSSAARGL